MSARTEAARLRLPIVGRRLALRSPESEDAPTIARWLKDRRVTRPISLPAQYTVRDAREHIARTRRGLRDGSSYGLSVIVREDGQLVGGCGLSEVNLRQRRAHVGYWIAPPLWGKGYASEAASLLIAAGFRELGLHRIHTGALPENHASIRVLRRLGFRTEGRAREEYLIDNRFRDSVLFGLLRSEFRPYRPRPVPTR
jgi:[ribosomal protein S5]-alanine N-acetyltransferase